MVKDTPFVRGSAKLQQRIRTISRTLGLPALMPEVGDLLYARTMRRFDRQVDPDENAWPPLAESTLRRKKAEGFEGKPPLVRKGDMRNAIRLIVGNATGATYTNTGAGFRIGIAEEDIAEYATIQNRGNQRIPARRFLGIGRLDVKAVDSLMRRKAIKLGLK